MPESLVEEALSLSKEGFRVFPVHSPQGNGCSCRKARCNNRGKHPCTHHGVHDASADAKVVTQMWNSYPWANIAIATGNGLVVVDVDGPQGADSLKALGAPRTATSSTGRGQHFYYEGDAGCRTKLAPGIDIRGQGGYVIAPPSRHANGAAYTWSRPLSEGIASAPEWVNHRRKASRAHETLASPAHPDLKHWPEGERNDRLFRHPAAMRALGMSPAEIAAALPKANAERCHPPLDPGEVAQIAKSAGQRPEGRCVDRRLLTLGLGPYAIAIYVALHSYTNCANRCFPSITTLAKATRMSRDTAIRAIKTLESAGFIRVERTRKHNVYTLL